MGSGSGSGGLRVECVWKSDNGSYATDHPSATSTDPDLPDIIDISQAEWDEIK
jgi:hypothetical protein